MVVMTGRANGINVAVRRTPGRPTIEDSEELRCRITEAAVEEFVDKGFEFGNVSRIAAMSGVTKATVYRLYGAKENLFKVAIRAALEQSQLVRWHIDARRDPEEVLREAAERISRSYTYGAVGALWHSVLAVKKRFPEFHEEVLTILRGESNAAALAVYLAKLHDGRQFDIPDPLMTAHHFSLLIGQGRELALPPRHSRDMEAARISQVVRMFVKALRAEDAVTAAPAPARQAPVMGIAAMPGALASFDNLSVESDASLPIRRKV
jgi:AcrR family transcriptional regulator